MIKEWEELAHQCKENNSSNSQDKNDIVGQLEFL